MQIYNLIAIACLMLMITSMLTVIVKLINKGRADRITYIRGFRKGQGALIYFFAIPLYWIGYIYAGQSVLSGLFSAIRKSVELIVLRYDITPIQELVNDNALYRFTIYLCFILVCINAILFLLSLFDQYIWNHFKKCQFKYSNREKIIIFGNNPQNISIYSSEHNRLKVIVDKITSTEALGLYMNDISYLTIYDYDQYVKLVVNNCIKNNNVTIAIINTEVDERNIGICRRFINCITQLNEQDKIACFGLLKIFVFGNPQYETIYEDIIADSFGCISYINKYQKIAIDFINKYPFAAFINNAQIDYDTSLIKDDVEINAFFIGFGKTNQQIFLTSVANNLFITNSKDGIDIKKIKYHLFDKNPAENNKSLNHNYNRYKNEFANINVIDYLPIPEYPAETFFHKLDVNDVKFYNETRNVMFASKNSVNFIIIGFGSDLENIDMAQKLACKCREWEIYNITIFVKVRAEHKGEHLLEKDNCYVIANESEVVYNINSIMGDPILKMAQMRNEVYDIEYELTQNGFKLTEEKLISLKKKAYRNWYLKKSQLERESSLYCCLSLRSKLNLMGLDYCPISDTEKPTLTEQEYFDIYAYGDMPHLDYYSVKVNGKAIVHYSLECKESRRKNMAIHEHLRWNSFMISKGMVPASKKQIIEETDLDGNHTNGRNYAVRRHGNITTFKGLEEFRKIVVKRDVKEDEISAQVEERKDVIKYNYQLLDDAFWLLRNTGYKIIRK